MNVVLALIFIILIRNTNFRGGGMMNILAIGKHGL